MTVVTLRQNNQLVMGIIDMVLLERARERT